MAWSRSTFRTSSWKHDAPTCAWAVSNSNTEERCSVRSPTFNDAILDRKAIALRFEAMAVRLEAMAIRLEVIAIRVEDIAGMWLHPRPKLSFGKTSKQHRSPGKIIMIS